MPCPINVEHAALLRGPGRNAAFIRFKAWYRLLPRAGLRAIRPHDLRYTYASFPLADRAPMIYVKEQLGHSSMNVTVALYGHVQPGAHRETVDRAGRGDHEDTRGPAELRESFDLGGGRPEVFA